MLDEAASRRTAIPAPDHALSLKFMAPIGEMNAEWLDGLTQIGCEITSFAADRIREDTAAGQALLHCRSPAQVWQIQAQYLLRALDQYAARTGKLVAMNRDMAARMHDRLKG
ncbi:phasin family protein [Paracoccaceae bacterium Fryx2]|nr:phasin family protein [Paracoccaceae bacterium Fryx2]